MNDQITEIEQLRQQVRLLQQERLDLLVALEQTQNIFKQDYELSRNVFDSMPGLLLVADARGKCIESNSSFNQALGIEANQIKGLDITNFFFDPEELNRCLASLHKHGFLRDYYLTLKPYNKNLPTVDGVFNINLLHNWLQQNYLYGSDFEDTAGFVFTGRVACEVQETNVATVEANRRLALLNLVSDRISSSLDINQVLQSVVTELGRLMGLDRCLLIEFDTNSMPGTGVVTHSYFNPHCANLKKITDKLIVPIDHPMLFKAWQTGKPLIADDTTTIVDEARNNSNYSILPPARSVVVVPVIFGSKTIALLTLAFVNSFHKWKPGEVELALEVAQRAAGAITNAHLFAQVMSERQQNSAILNSMAEGVVTLDREGRVRSLNPAAEQLLDVKAAQVIGCCAQKALPFEITLNYKRYECCQKVIEVVTTPLLDETLEEIGTVSLLHDITEETRVERMKDEFINLASHEMRTPLTSLTGALGLLAEDDVGSMNEMQKEFLRVAQNNNTRLTDLVNSIIDISSLEGGRIKLDLGPVLLTEAVERALTKQIMSEIKRKALKLVLNLQAQPGVVEADASRLVQIFENLLSNASKFTPEGGTIEICSSPLGLTQDKVRITIADNGIGFNVAESEHLFDKFYRADNSLTRKVGGSGLGLTITRSLVQLHGSQLEFSSIPGQGSQFSFVLRRLNEH